MTITVLAWLVALVEFGGLIALGVLLIVSRRQLKGARASLERSRARQGNRRRRRRGVAPFAIRTAFKTADSLITKGIGATVRNSVEDLAGWAQVERPDLARLTADGDVVIAFSDIEDSTAQNEALGDREWVRVLERHNRLIQSRVDDHGGHVVKNQGDGFMIAFADAGRAVLCGIAVQRALFDDADRWEGIRVRIGIHLGPSVRRGDDLFGRNVAMAARIAGQADGGEILISESVREAIDGLAEIELCAPSEVELKGFEGWHNLYPVKLPTDP
ncbi:adenylate/guanylate cyclase domain-containing protein [Mycobacterium sp. Aquia_213]|uniref:adenylate/guanylate cyclase domain-containing protein n=1 Tax=Mycobacterium sp. Aquia_213 TaxID=2991728 RepID=UPI002270A747|nr:adenylate/guanylate cyclase domain-containing protein [Mycobacterium sp. Aquia_213]WAC91564.1 adenylate/guanylate cyclase domain-containing protein [Mycobacterium sp. Aquia_213]